MKQLRNLRTNFEQEVLELFDQYKIVQLQWIQNQDPEMSSKFGKDLKEITKKMNYMTNTVLKRIEFISIITRLSVFTAAEILKIIGDPNDPFLIEEEEITLPVKLEKFWLPLIRFIHRKGELIRFLVELLGKNGERHIFCQKFVVGLTRIIMFDSSTLAATKTFFSNNPLMTSSYSWSKIIYACAMGINKYSMELAKQIAETKINDAHKYTDLFVLMAMKTGQFIPPEIKQMNAEQTFSKQLKDVKDGIVFTLEDTLNDVERTQKDKGLNSLKNSIRLYTGPIDFSQIPIGTVLNPIVPKEDQTKEDICLVEIRPSPHAQCIFG
ncbi:hypothetical protein CEXT_209281 [Caerostris extrusa]|uniref:Uncharacterized protein n=1 Tax=Caerostris extrusa TaxID=172846 RepID=A0AAV4P278_CAEEX|nr:hypothetical protein CEXT_209281 [Caerostris extrusa]